MPGYGCQIFGHLMRPARTHGPAHRVDRGVRPVRRVTVGAAGQTPAVGPAARPVWAMAVVVQDVLAKHTLQLPVSEDQESVQRLTAHRAHPPLRKGIRPRRPDRREDDLDALTCEHRVEAGGVLGVPVPDRKPEALAVGEVKGTDSWPAASPRRRRGCWWLQPGGPVWCAARSPSTRTGS